ncbi:uncharacterized protein LOC142531386 [Primulina tabacum]|uniref:uncharacterized protein LOC142531386 n=1 Tax=Primulina tabacum TaxID=48773 RepID=UPI003F592692
MTNDRINYGYFVDFQSVKSMENVGYITKLSFVEAAGLRPLLTAGKHVYLDSLSEFFTNARIEGNSIVSSVKGSSISISEITFQENFNLNSSGLSNIMDVSDETKENAWNILAGNFSYVSGSFEKMVLKKEFQVLCDIMAKHIENKSGDFGQVTKTKYCFLAAIVTNTVVNWSSILYHKPEEMVTKRNSNWGFGLVLSRILDKFGLQLEKPTLIHAFRILDSRTLIKQRGEGQGRRKGKRIEDGDTIVVEKIESKCQKRKTSVNVGEKQN